MDWEVLADEEAWMDAEAELAYEEMLLADQEDEDRVYDEVIIPDYFAALDASEAA